MTDAQLRAQARIDAETFLRDWAEYRMGYVEAELPNPMTRRLSQTCLADAGEGAKLLLSVDRDVASRAAAALSSEDFRRFADAIQTAILTGGRVLFSGCGSSGRLSMQLERSWRRAIADQIALHPEAKKTLDAYLESVENIMTGGDFAVIRAAESFEDSPRMGRAQTKERKLTEKDVLVGVTATSVLGTAAQALEDGAQVWMLVRTEPTPLKERMSRVREVFDHPRCSALVLPCGPMALTGSTRMQSSTFEQFAAAVALETTLCAILERAGVRESCPAPEAFGEAFYTLTGSLLGEKCISALREAILAEQEVYEHGGLITMFSDEYLMDILTDTTERAPTFSTPPFRSDAHRDQPPSWAFAKHPSLPTAEAWKACFLRAPHCIEWGKETYAQLGFTEREIARIPDVGLAALEQFPVGCEPDAEREQSPCSRAIWIGTGSAPAAFREQASRYHSSAELTSDGVGADFPETKLHIFEHIALKLLLNTLSTAAMARMGRISGNWMTNLALSNKKLVDRSARIVSDLCGVSYETALEENYYSKFFLEQQNNTGSPVQETIRRLEEMK